MRTVPTSWLAKPVGALPKLGNTLPFRWDEHFEHALFGRLPQSMIILAEAKMNDRRRNAMGVEAAGIDGHIIPVIGCHFGKTPNGQISRLHSPHALLKGSPIARQPGSVMREHVTGIVDLNTPTPDVIALAEELVVPRHVNVIGGAVLVERLLPFEFLQINAHRIIQVTVQMMADHAVGIGKSRWDIAGNVN